MEVTLAVHDTAPTKHPRIVAAQQGTFAAIALALGQAKLALEKGLETLRIDQAIYENDKIFTSRYAVAHSEVIVS